jgi:hypothetical protein
MKNRKLLDRITEQIQLELNPNKHADDKVFTRAAHHCGMSRNQLTRIYIEHWNGLGRRKFAEMILAGRLIHAKDARGDFYSTFGRDWYHRKDGTFYYFRGQFKGQPKK